MRRIGGSIAQPQARQNLADAWLSAWHRAQAIESEACRSSRLHRSQKRALGGLRREHFAQVIMAPVGVPAETDMRSV